MVNPKTIYKIPFFSLTHKGVSLLINVFGNQWQQEHLHSPADQQHDFSEADEGSFQ